MNYEKKEEMVSMRKFATKYILLFPLMCLSSCGDNPFNDNEKIKDTDYAQIRIEMERCKEVANEGSAIAAFRWSPKTECLKHLKSRIINTGKAKPGDMNEL